MFLVKRYADDKDSGELQRWAWKVSEVALVCHVALSSQRKYNGDYRAYQLAGGDMPYGEYEVLRPGVFHIFDLEYDARMQRDRLNSMEQAQHYARVLARNAISHRNAVGRNPKDLPNFRSNKPPSFSWRKMEKWQAAGAVEVLKATP